MLVPCALEEHYKILALAPGLADRIKMITAGKDFDLTIWDIEIPAELAYAIGFNFLHSHFFGEVESPSS